MFGTLDTVTLSHPARGGWIEIIIYLILKSLLKCPTPHGVGGLKFALEGQLSTNEKSHPARGGWIEIPETT